MKYRDQDDFHADFFFPPIDHNTRTTRNTRITAHNQYISRNCIDPWQSRLRHAIFVTLKSNHTIDFDIFAIMSFFILFFGLYHEALTCWPSTGRETLDEHWAAYGLGENNFGAQILKLRNYWVQMIRPNRLQPIARDGVHCKNEL